VIGLLRSVAHFGAHVSVCFIPRAALRLPVARISGPFRAMKIPNKLCVLTSQCRYSPGVTHPDWRSSHTASPAAAGGWLVLQLDVQNRMMFAAIRMSGPPLTLTLACRRRRGSPCYAASPWRRISDETAANSSCERTLSMSRIIRKSPSRLPIPLMKSVFIRVTSAGDGSI